MNQTQSALVLQLEEFQTKLVFDPNLRVGGFKIDCLLIELKGP